MKYFVFFAIFLSTTVSVLSQELPPENIGMPVGDGITDDTTAIQQLLDGPNTKVYLPPPSKCYLISKPLRMHSDQTLHLDPNTVIRLADGAMQYMLVNDDTENGNRNIQVIGGIWDGNNLTQTCDYHQGVKGSEPYDPNRYLGCIMLFINVENLRIEKLTIKDPETFAINLAKVRWFTVQDITFDFNQKRGNMDGVHVQGGSQHGTITNLKGDTNDDMVALNADDANMFEITQGSITDIQVDGLFCTNGYTAVRLNSAGHPVKRVRISNIFGSFRYNGVSLTHHNVHPGAPTVFEDILIDGVFMAKQLEEGVKPEPWNEAARRSHAIVWVASTAQVDHLSIKNLSRREWMLDSSPTLQIDAKANVKQLHLSDVLQVNHVETPLKLIANEGTIEQIFVNGVTVRDAKTEPITGSGSVEKVFGEIVVE